MKFFTLFLLLFCAFQTHVFAQNICKLDSITKRKIDSMYVSASKANQIKGVSIAIVEKGEIVYATGYGLEDMGNQIPASAASIYRIGSITKSFTALSILQLQEKGLLHIDSSIQNYLPEFELAGSNNQSSALPLRAIMSHTAGLPGDLMNGFFTEEPPASAWTLAQLKQIKPSYPVNYCHAYSNLGFELLGAVIQRTGELTYEDYLIENIFNPLHLTSTFVYPEEGMRTPFSYNGKKEVLEPPIRDAAAGLIHSNVLDMANYLMMYLNQGRFQENTLVSAASIAQMQTNQLQQIVLNDGADYGLGLYSKDFYYKTPTDSIAVKVVGHGGDTYTFHADMKFIPELGIGVVILTNTVGGQRINAGEKLLSLYLKSKYDAKLKPIPVEAPKVTYRTPKPGHYILTNLVFEIQNTEKFKIKQGPALIVATHQEAGYYTLTARLFGLIPLPIKNQAVFFEELNSKLYVRSLDLKTKKSAFIGQEIHPEPISQAWEQAYGKYTITNAFACRNCQDIDITFDDAVLEVGEQNGYLKFSMKNAGQMINFVYYANCTEDKVALTLGIGRNNGETFRILENGNIYYSGFEFKRQ
jgi:CubicO group peptidase (beta-lactamase class C family)